MPRLVPAWFVDLLFPLRCAGCSSFDQMLCDACEASLEPATGPGRCGHCSAKWDGADFCPRCFHMQALAGVRAPYEMAGAARHLVHNLKYRRYHALAPVMAAHIRTAAAPLAVDGWHAVPLHKSRFKERGFNQSELLLRESGMTAAPGSLVRVRKTAAQVGRHFTERRQNVSNAFEYSGPRLDGLRIGLVDDVVTTGATVNECARVLADAGAKEVWALAFARASYEPDTPAEIAD